MQNEAQIETCEFLLSTIPFLPLHSLGCPFVWDRKERKLT